MNNLIQKDDFHLNKFVDNINFLYYNYMDNSFPNNDRSYVEIKVCKKYIKLIQDHAAFAFINRSNGDIYKPATWRAPAKHVRGNLFSLNNGMESISTNNGTTQPHIRYLK
jgi:hypothetical protein